MEIKQRINVSGYRGIWGETLTKEVVILYTRAFVTFLKTKIDNIFCPKCYFYLALKRFYEDCNKE